MRRMPRIVFLVLLDSPSGFQLGNFYFFLFNKKSNMNKYRVTNVSHLLKNFNKNKIASFSYRVKMLWKNISLRPNESAEFMAHELNVIAKRFLKDGVIKAELNPTEEKLIVEQKPNIEQSSAVAEPNVIEESNVVIEQEVVENVIEEVAKDEAIVEEMKQEIEEQTPDGTETMQEDAPKKPKAKLKRNIGRPNDANEGDSES